MVDGSHLPSELMSYLFEERLCVWVPTGWMLKASGDLRGAGAGPRGEGLSSPCVAAACGRGQLENRGMLVCASCPERGDLRSSGRAVRCPRHSIVCRLWVIKRRLISEDKAVGLCDPTWQSCEAAGCGVEVNTHKVPCYLFPSLSPCILFHLRFCFLKLLLSPLLLLFSFSFVLSFSVFRLFYLFWFSPFSFLHYPVFLITLVFSFPNLIYTYICISILLLLFTFCSLILILLSLLPSRYRALPSTPFRSFSYLPLISSHPCLPFTSPFPPLFSIRPLAHGFEYLNLEGDVSVGGGVGVGWGE